jgi:hypothetical protein
MAFVRTRPLLLLLPETKDQEGDQEEAGSSISRTGSTLRHDPPAPLIRTGDFSVVLVGQALYDQLVF